MRRLSVILASATLCACQPAVDPTFGRSYDECVLKNASKGDDDGSRATATDICARHFTRAPFSREEKAVQLNAAVRVGVQGNAFGDLVPGSTDTSTTDQLNVFVKNNDSDFIVRQVRTDLPFYKSPPDAKNHFDPKNIIDTVEWTLDTDVPPNGQDTLIGTFTGGHELSPFFSATTTLTRVLPQAGTATNGLIESR